MNDMPEARMPEEPLFSIVMPVFCVGPYLQTTLESLYAQTERDFEVVVVDDGSTDETSAVLEAQTDPRLRVFHQENAGVSVARNRAIREARGRWVAFMDGDDAWRPNHLELARQSLEAHPEYVWYCGIFKRVRAAKLDGADYRDAAPRGRLLAVNWYVEGCRQILPCSSLVVRRDALRELPDPFPPGVKMFEDNVALCRFARRHPMMLLRLTESMIYLERSSSATGQYGQAARGAATGVALDVLRLHQQLDDEPGCSREAHLMYREFALWNWWTRITASSLIVWLPEIDERRRMTGAFFTAWLRFFCRFNNLVCRAMRWGIRRRINAVRREMDRRAVACRKVLEEAEDS